MQYALTVSTFLPWGGLSDQARHVNGRHFFQINPTNMTNLLFHFLPLSSIKSRNMLSVRGGVRGVQKFYSISWRFRSFWKLTKKNWKFSKSQILTKIDRHFWMPYLVTFLRFLPWKIKVKRSLLTVCRFWKKLACLVCEFLSCYWCFPDPDIHI